MPNELLPRMPRRFILMSRNANKASALGPSADGGGGLLRLIFKRDAC